MTALFLLTSVPISLLHDSFHIANDVHIVG